MIDKIFLPFTQCHSQVISGKFVYLIMEVLRKRLSFIFNTACQKAVADDLLPTNSWNSSSHFISPAADKAQFSPVPIQPGTDSFRLCYFFIYLIRNGNSAKSALF